MTASHQISSHYRNCNGQELSYWVADDTQGFRRRTRTSLYQSQP